MHELHGTTGFNPSMDKQPVLDCRHCTGACAALHQCLCTVPVRQDVLALVIPKKCVMIQFKPTYRRIQTSLSQLTDRLLGHEFAWLATSPRGAGAATTSGAVDLS